MMKASIVVINYNDKLRVGRAIESAINQTWNDIEVIVVDDGSDAETRQLYKPYKDRIWLIQRERDDEDRASRTPSGARNAGIRAATGDFICFLDSDNYYSTDFVESLIKHDSDVAFCNWEIVGLENYKANINEVWNQDDALLNNYLKHQHLDHQCLLIKKSYLNSVGVYDERLPRSQDCDMIVRLILKNGVVNHIPKTLFHFEKHEEDQMKSVASIHGKTLWTLKNNINVSWLMGMARDHMATLSILKGIEDFCSKKEWEIDYNKSDFKTIKEQHESVLGEQKSERVSLDK